MSPNPVSPRRPVSRLVGPASALVLAGLVSVYAFRGANADNSAPPPIVAQSTAATEVVSAAPAGPLVQRAARVNARAATDPNSAVFPDLASGFAQLHQGMATSPVKAADRDRAIADLDNRHESETVDAAWSASSEQGLAAAVAAPVMVNAGFNAKDVSTDCRSRSCRISARFDNSSEARDWADRLLTQMAGSISQAKVAVLPQADGGFEVRVYGARKQA